MRVGCIIVIPCARIPAFYYPVHLFFLFHIQFIQQVLYSKARIFNNTLSTEAILRVGRCGNQKRAVVTNS